VTACSSGTITILIVQYDINTYRTSTSSVYYLVVPLGKRQHSHSNAVKNTHYCLAVNLHSTVAPTIMPAVLSPLYSVVAASSRSSTCIMRSASRGCPCFVLSLRTRAGNFDTPSGVYGRLHIDSESLRGFLRWYLKCDHPTRTLTRTLAGTLWGDQCLDAVALG